MITIKINGGLGNQMFQYATAKSVSLRNNKDLLLDVNEFNSYNLRNFELLKYNITSDITENKSIIDNFFFKMLNRLGLFSFLLKNYYFEKTLLFDEKVFEFTNDIYLVGFFQSEQYFSDIRSILLKDFTLKDNLTNYSEFIKDDINKNNNTVSLHIRRGDYISNSSTNVVHGICNLQYYIDSIKFLEAKLGVLKLYVFSDDIVWAKNNLDYKNIIYVTSNELRPPHEDIYLMSLCNNNIIANSSFSWWGGWLNKNKNKIVIAPKQWFANEHMQAQSKNIIPSSWTRL